MYFAICLKNFAIQIWQPQLTTRFNFIQAQYLNVQICIHSTLRYSRFHARLMMSQNAFIPHPLYYWWILFSFNDFLINWHNNDSIIITSSNTAFYPTRILLVIQGCNQVWAQSMLKGFNVMAHKLFYVIIWYNEKIK